MEPTSVLCRSSPTPLGECSPTSVRQTPRQWCPPRRLVVEHHGTLVVSSLERPRRWSVEHDTTRQSTRTGIGSDRSPKTGVVSNQTRFQSGTNHVLTSAQHAESCCHWMSERGALHTYAVSDVGPTDLNRLTRGHRPLAGPSPRLAKRVKRWTLWPLNHLSWCQACSPSSTSAVTTDVSGFECDVCDSAFRPTQTVVGDRNRRAWSDPLDGPNKDGESSRRRSVSHPVPTITTGYRYLNLSVVPTPTHLSCRTLCYRTATV